MSSLSPLRQFNFVVEHNATLFEEESDGSGDMFPFTITQYDSISTPTHFQPRSCTALPLAGSVTPAYGGAVTAPRGASFSQDDSTTSCSLFPVVTPSPSNVGRPSIHAPTPTSFTGKGGGLAEYEQSGNGSSTPASSVSGFLHPFSVGGGGPSDPKSRSMSSHDVLAKIQELELSRQTKVLVTKDRSGFLLEMAKHEQRLAELVQKKVERCQHLHFLEDVRTTRGVPTEDRTSGSHFSKRISSLLQKTTPTTTTATNPPSSSLSYSGHDDSTSSDTGDDEPLEGVRDRILKATLHTAAVESMKQNSLRGGPQWGSVAFEAGVQVVERELWAAHQHNLDQAPSPLVLKHAAPVLNHDHTPIMLSRDDVQQKRAVHAEEVFQSRKASRLNLQADVGEQNQTDTTATVTTTSADGQVHNGSSPVIKPSKYQSQHYGRLPPIATLTTPPSTFRPKTADSTTTNTSFKGTFAQNRRLRNGTSLKKLTQHSRPASAAASAGSGKPVNVEWEQLDAAHVMLVKYRGVLDDLEREEAEYEKERLRLTGVSILGDGSGIRTSSTKRTKSKKSTSRRHSRQRRQQQQGHSSPAASFMDSLANEEVMGESFFKADHERHTHASTTHHHDDDDDDEDDHLEDGETSFAELISSTGEEDHHDAADESGEDDWYIQHVEDRKQFQRESHAQKQNNELVRLYGPLLNRPSSSSILRPRPASASMLRPTAGSDIRGGEVLTSTTPGDREGEGPLSLLDAAFTKDEQRRHPRRGSQKGQRKGMRASGSMSLEGHMASSALLVLSSSSSSDVDDRPFSSGSGGASPSTVDHRSSILIPQHLSPSDLSHALMRPTSSSIIKTPTPRQARLQERGRLPPMRSAMGGEGLSPYVTPIHYHAPPPSIPVSSRHRPQSGAARVAVPRPSTPGYITTDVPSVHMNKAPKKITRPWSADGRVTSTYWRNWSAMKKLEDLEKSREASTRPSSRGYWHNTDDDTATSLPPTPNTSTGRPKSGSRLGNSSSALRPPRPATSSARVSLHPSRGPTMSGFSGAVVNSIRLDDDDGEYATTKQNDPYSSGGGGLPPRPQSTGTQKNVRFASNHSPPAKGHHNRPSSSSGNNGPTSHSVPQLMSCFSIDTTTNTNTNHTSVINSTSLRFQTTDGNDISGVMRGSALEVLALVDEDGKVGDLSIGSIDVVNSTSEQSGGPLSDNTDDDAFSLSPPRTAPHGSSKTTAATGASDSPVVPQQSRFVLHKRLPSRVSSAPANRLIGTHTKASTPHEVVYPPKTVQGCHPSSSGAATRIASTAHHARPSSAAAHLNAACRKKLNELESMPLDLFRARERVSNNSANNSIAATFSGQDGVYGGGEELAVLLCTEDGRKAFYDQLLQGIKRDRDAVFDSYRPTHVLDTEGGVVPRSHQSALQARALALGIDTIKMGVELKLLRFDEARSGASPSSISATMKEEALARSDFLRMSALVMRTGRIPVGARGAIPRAPNKEVQQPSHKSSGQPPAANRSPLLSPTFNDRQDYALIQSYAHQLTPNIFLRSPAQLRELTVISTPRSIKDSTAKEADDPFMSLVNMFVSDELRHMELEKESHKELDDKNQNYLLPTTTTTVSSQQVYSAVLPSKRLRATIVEAERRYLELLNMLSASNLDLQRRCATTIQRAFRKWMATWSDDDDSSTDEGDDEGPPTSQLSPSSGKYDDVEGSSSFSMDDEDGDDIAAALTSPPW